MVAAARPRILLRQSPLFLYRPNPPLRLSSGGPAEHLEWRRNFLPQRACSDAHIVFGLQIQPKARPALENRLRRSAVVGGNRTVPIHQLADPTLRWYVDVTGVADGP